MRLGHLTFVRPQVLAAPSSGHSKFRAAARDGDAWSGGEKPLASLSRESNRSSARERECPWKLRLSDLVANGFRLRIDEFSRATTYNFGTKIV